MFFAYCEQQRCSSAVHMHRLISAFEFATKMETIISNFYIQNLKPLTSFCCYTGWFVSDIEHSFSRRGFHEKDEHKCPICLQNLTLIALHSESLPLKKSIIG